MSAGRYVLALDQGTTSSRALLFDQAGQVSFTAQQEFRQIFPQPGWVEHDPEEIWTSQLECARKVLAQARIDGAGVAAVGITNQRETTLVWERATGRPIYNAIVWQDRRTAPLCDALRTQGADSIIQQKTGLVLDAYFSATKLRWILDNVVGARARAERGELAFGTVDSWLTWRLSEGNQHCTDVSNAARTMLYNIHRLEWDQELLDLFAIPAALLPRVYANDQALGNTRRELFATAIPLAGIAGDQQAALFGQMCVRPGMAKNTYGTGCFMLMNTGAQAIASRNRLLTTIAWQRAARTDYAMEGSVFVAGAAVQWLRDGLGIIKHAADVEPLARSVPDAGGVVMVPAFTGMGAPHWDAYARGALFGLTRGSGAGHIARAALESIALQSAEVLVAMQADASVDLTELRVDGGASRNDLLMQIQADVLGVPVVRPVVTETTALGAAYLAGLNVGFWSDLAEVQQQWRPQRVFEPSLAVDARAELRRRWTKAVQRAQGWEAADK